MARKKSNPLQRVNIHLTVEQYEQLRNLSDRTGRSVAEWLRQFADEGLIREQRRKREDR